MEPEAALVTIEQEGITSVSFMYARTAWSLVAQGDNADGMIARHSWNVRLRPIADILKQVLRGSGEAHAEVEDEKI